MNKLRFHIHDNDGFTVHAKLAFTSEIMFQLYMRNDCGEWSLWNQELAYRLDGEEQERMLKLMHVALIMRPNVCPGAYSGPFLHMFSDRQLVMTVALISNDHLRVKGHENPFRVYHDIRYMVVGDNTKHAWLWPAGGLVWANTVKLDSAYVASLPQEVEP